MLNPTYNHGNNSPLNDGIEEIILRIGGQVIPPSGSSSNLLAYRNTGLSNAPQNIIASANSTLWGWNLFNTNNDPVFIKFYNEAAPVIGTDTPVFTLMMPVRISATRPSQVFQESANVAHLFTTAMSIVAVTGLADASTTAPTTPVFVEIHYKA